MKKEFYLADKVEHNYLTGKDLITPNVLHFKLERPSLADPKVTELLFDNLATKAHVSDHFSAYRKFKESHPDFKCPWPEVEVEKGMAPVSESENA